MSIPVPSALVRHQVTWPIGWAGGTPGPLAGARGHVTFEASATVIAYSDATVLPEAVTTPVVGGVMAPVTLIENDPDVWNWKVTPRLGVAWEPFHIDVTGPVNVASAATTPGKGPVRVVKGDQGYQGKSVTRMVQVDESMLRADLADPATGVTETEYFDLPRGPEGPYGGTEVSDPQVASFIGRSTGTATAAAMDKAYRRGFSVKEWGAKGDGTTDDTLAIQAAADAVHGGDSGATLYFPEGTYRTTDTIHIVGNTQGMAATVSADHDGVALRLGTTAWPPARDLAVAMPHVTYPRKPASGWDETSCGIEIANISGSEIAIPHVGMFHTGIRETAYGTGNVHNTITLGQIVNNKINLRITTSSGGWANQNVHINGQLAHYSNEGSSIPGARHILIDEAPPGGFPINNHTFIGTSIEGNVAEFHADIGGYNNLFLNLRWEAAPPKVRWGANSSRNQIMYGHSSDLIVQTSSPQAGARNHILSPNRGMFASVELSNPGGDDAPVEETYAYARPGYVVRKTVRTTGMKRPADTHDRLRLDHESGRVYLGGGNAAPTAFIGSVGDRLWIGSTTQENAPPSGSAAALPVAPAGYMQVVIEGASRFIPYY